MKPKTDNDYSGYVDNENFGIGDENEEVKGNITFYKFHLLVFTNKTSYM